MDLTISRRRFLAHTALAGAGAAAILVAGQRGAAALTTQPMDATAHAAYLQACGGPQKAAYHRQLLDEAMAKLRGQASEAEIEAAIAQLTCPVCGCPLAQAQ